MSDEVVEKVARPDFRTVLNSLNKAEQAELDNAVGDAARQAAQYASEAKRDGVLAVALAIKRRGQNPLTDWTTQDADTAYAIAEQLMALHS